MNLNKLVADKLCKRLESAIENNEQFYWIKPFAKGCPRTGAVSFESRKNYRGINRVLLDPSKEMVSHGSLMALRKKHPDKGYHIRKGTHGNIVIYFKRVPVMDENGEPKMDEHTGLPVTKSFARYYTVFDREDIIDNQGVNLPSKFPIEQYDHTSEEEQLEMALLKFNAIVKSYCDKYNITIEETNQGTEAYFMPSQNKVRIPAKSCFSSLGSWMGCFFHELVHSSMLPLGRNKIDKGVPLEETMKSYSVEELIAELGSAMLMASLNLPESEERERQNLAYLQGWSKELANNKQLQASLIYAASQAEKAAELIMSEFERNLEQLENQNNKEQEENDRYDKDEELKDR